MKNILIPILFLIIILNYSCKKCPECPDVQNNNETVTQIDTVYINENTEGNANIIGRNIPIISQSVDILYYNCGNTLNFDLEEGEAVPDIKASSANVLKSKSDERKFTVVPTGKTCVISCIINNEDSYHKWDRKYKVIKPPKPEIQLLVNGKEYNGASPINKKSNVVLRLKPDADFKASMPRDARYMISNVDLLAQRSLGAPTKIGTYSGLGKDATKGIPIPLGNKLKADTPGTIIYFKIKSIYRMNFQNKKIEEKYADREFYVSAVIK